MKIKEADSSCEDIRQCFKCKHFDCLMNCTMWVAWRRFCLDSGIDFGAYLEQQGKLMKECDA